MPDNYQLSPNQLVWWIDSMGILHSCAQINTPPMPAHEQGLYAQGLVDPVSRTGTISHINNMPASHPAIPRELFDVLDRRFPQTRWWIFDHTESNSPAPEVPVTAHL
ncbi:MAG: hypothetical protein AB8C13_06770 [Phycisphaerales bacterium]